MPWYFRLIDQEGARDIWCHGISGLLIKKGLEIFGAMVFQAY